jgi:hypothetical protein
MSLAHQTANPRGIESNRTHSAIEPTQADNRLEDPPIAQASKFSNNTRARGQMLTKMKSAITARGLGMHALVAGMPMESAPAQGAKDVPKIRRDAILQQLLPNSRETSDVGRRRE